MVAVGSISKLGEALGTRKGIQGKNMSSEEQKKIEELASLIQKVHPVELTPRQARLKTMALIKVDRSLEQ